MKRVNVRHFTYEPNIVGKRSGFDLSHSYLTTFNTGDVCPIACFEVLPGDTFKAGCSSFIRMQSLLTPIFGRLYCSIDWFFVPARITWEHWENLFGQNDTLPWDLQTTYSVPQVTAPTGGWLKGSLAEKFGIPIGVDNISVDALQFRAFSMIYNDWYRSEDVDTPLNIPKDDITVVGSNGTTVTTDLVKGGMLPKSNKSFDQFTSCLPAPQKGKSVNLPLGPNAPVYFGGVDIPIKADYNYTPKFKSMDTTNNVWNTISGFNSIIANNSIVGRKSDSGTATNDGTFSNAFADMSNATATTVNELREAFQLQKLLERDARSGTRYFEYLSSAFGVLSSDARLQRPEYLGGEFFNINVNSVVQNSETGTTPQGNLTGISQTRYTKQDFVKSFEEHGYCIACATIRYQHSYEQGIPKQFLRKDRLDFYDPILANLGEQKILNKEIYAQGSSVLNPSTGKPYDDEVFGYNEAWSHYRFSNNIITGELRSKYATSLNSWHLGDNYNALPTLSDSWLKEDPNNVDRVIAVSQQNADQFLCDFWINCIAYRRMPVYSIPGLIDHH